MFNAPPKGSFTDQLEDTLCYLKLTQLIKKHCKGKKFNLIEYLTQTIYELICEFIFPCLDFVSQIKIKTHKKNPPVEDVHADVVFTYNVHINQKNLLELREQLVKGIDRIN